MQFFFKKVLCFILLIQIVDSSAFAQTDSTIGPEFGAIPLTNKSSTVLNKSIKKYHLFKVNAGEISDYLNSNKKSQIPLTLNFPGIERFSLNLEASNILSPDYKLISNSTTGRQISKKRKNIAFEGFIENQSNSNVRLTISENTLYGVIQTKKKEYFIEPLHYTINDADKNSYILYETKDVIQDVGAFCGVTYITKEVDKLRRRKLQENVSDCYRVDLAIASDSSAVAAVAGGNVSAMEEFNIAMMNIVFPYFQSGFTTQVELVLTGQYISTSTATDPYGPDYNCCEISSQLGSFEAWSDDGGFEDISFDLAHNITNHFPRPGTVGLAGVGVLGSDTLNVGVTSISGVTWLTFIHELGHNFGLSHSFEEGQGSTGGFMDYGDGKINGQYGWNLQYRLIEFEAEVSSAAQADLIIPCDSIPPEALFNFTGSCDGSLYKFSNLSVGAPTSYSWTFIGGIPANSIDKEPSVMFPTQGPKTVTLTVTNRMGSNTTSKTIAVVGTSESNPCTYHDPTIGSNDVGTTFFSLNEISKSSGGCITDNGSYFDYSCSDYTTLETNMTYSVAVDNIFGSQPRRQLFIDYNDNGDFTDENELIYNGFDPNFLFTTPITITPKNKLLRARLIVKVFSDTIDPCYTPDGNGTQVEDYGVVFVDLNIDSDNDGVPYSNDSDDTNPYICQDLDMDGCDDCSVGTDGFGPLADFNPFNDGPDDDCDGICNSSDTTANLIYVKADADGVGDGSSWASAFTDLQAAIDQVCLCENPDSITIWVAAGSYYPTKDKNGDTSPTDSRTKTFYIDKDLKIYGGFQGNEDAASFDLSSRDFEANQTILSGDLMQNDTLNIPLDSLVVDGIRTDNTYHVVWMYQLSANAVLDGFTVRDGNGNSNGASANGGGILNEGAGSVSSPTISNCYFTYNSATSHGGAIFNGEGSSTTNPSLTACTFSYNWAERGAAIYNTSSAGGKSSPIVTNCVFTQHSGVFGGAIMNFAVSAESSPSFINCTFSNNTASQSGGAVYNWGHESGGISNTQIINCGFINNSAPYGAAMLNSATNTGTCSPVISNSIFWGNNASVAGSVLYNGSAVPEINYSLVDVANFDVLKVGGGTHNVTGGTGMIYNEDPQFVDAASSNFNLGVCSPAIDAGLDTINFELVDIEGNMRKLKLSAGESATIDMGAIEAKEILELDGCTICDSDSGECLSCFIENCITCISDSQCSECAPGFYLVGGVCVACTAVDHCTGEVTCTSDSDSQCSECAEGFVIAIDGTCVDLDACESNPCGPNAYCIDLPAPEVGGVCSCNDGFLGDGITCIPYRDTSIYLNAQGMAAIDTSYFYNGSSNNFDITSATLSKYSFSCDDIGPQSIVLTVNYNNPDPAYSSSSHTMIVTVIDTVRPIARCRNTTVYLDAQGVASIIDSSYINNGSSDNCDIKTASLSMSTFSCDDIGDQTVTLTVTDISGNINSCNATTTVIDIISPIIMCQDTTIYLDASGLFAIDSSYINNGSSDNCGIKTTSLSKSTFSCDDIGNQTVTLTATDVSDNVNSCISTVTVKDIEVTTPSITGEVTYCTSLQGVSYSVSDDINVDSYEWSYTGTGVTINSDNGASITIDFGAAATAGTLSVKLRSTCGIVDSANIVLTQAPPEVCSIIRCIEGNLLVSGEQLSLPNAPDIFKVTGILSADTIISSKLSFYAEQAIELFPGFSVAQSTVFLAAIEACEEE